MACCRIQRICAQNNVKAFVAGCIHACIYAQLREILIQVQAVSVNNNAVALKGHLVGIDVAQAHKLGVAIRCYLRQLFCNAVILVPTVKIQCFVGHVQRTDVNFGTVANLYAARVHQVDVAACGIQLAVNLRSVAACNVVKGVKAIIAVKIDHGVSTDRKIVPFNNAVCAVLSNIQRVSLGGVKAVVIKNTVPSTRQCSVAHHITACTCCHYRHRHNSKQNQSC